jgi:hydroxymethylglutaryl-CoA lyase
MNGAIDAISRAGFNLIRKVSVFTAASESFSKRNTNASIAETIERFKPVVAIAHDNDLDVRGYVSCVIACPFEGPILPEKSADVCHQLIDLGVDELDLGDTIGAATPDSVAKLLAHLARYLPSKWSEGFATTLHLHDTFGRAAECVKAALDMGIRSFDGSVAGLGGCPYASTPGKRAPGNISTETLVRTIHDAGFETGVNLDRLAEAADFARKIVSDARLRASTDSAS